MRKDGVGVLSFGGSGVGFLLFSNAYNLSKSHKKAGDRLELWLRRQGQADRAETLLLPARAVLT